MVDDISVNRSYWKGKKVFVTGATGFIGGWLSRKLVTFGAQVVCLVRNIVPRSLFFQSELKNRVVSIFGSLQDLRLLERVLQEYEIDTCFHLAAESIIPVANKSPLSTFESNIRGTWHVLDATRCSPSVKRVIIASSDKAYGIHTHLPYREDSELRARYPYDASKACADLLARTYFHSYGLPVGIARCANTFGGGDLNFSRVVPGTILSLLKGQLPIIRSDGRYTRDYLYIDDAVLAYLTLGRKLDDENIRGEAFNFSSGTPVKVLDLVKRIILVSGKENVVPVVLNEVKNEIKEQSLSSEKARRLLGWAPNWTLDTGLRETYRWYDQFLSKELRG